MAESGKAGAVPRQDLYPIHWAVWHNNVGNLSRLLDTNQVWSLTEWHWHSDSSVTLTVTVITILQELSPNLFPMWASWYPHWHWEKRVSFQKEYEHNHTTFLSKYDKSLDRLTLEPDAFKATHYWVLVKCLMLPYFTRIKRYNKTNLWKFQLISLFLLRENSKNAFSIFVFILFIMTGVFISRDENSLFDLISLIIRKR